MENRDRVDPKRTEISVSWPHPALYPGPSRHLRNLRPSEARSERVILQCSVIRRPSESRKRIGEEGYAHQTT
jgi:hypothetical protein